MAEVTLTSYIVLGVGLFMLLNSAAISVYAERRVAAFMQNRVGPNRVGPLGLLQPIADVLKLILKEDVTPDKGNKVLHTIAPMIPVITALLTVAVIPFGEGLYATDINAGVLYLLAVASLGVYGVTLAGWASNSKYSLLGGLRAAAQSRCSDDQLRITARYGRCIRHSVCRLTECCRYSCCPGELVVCIFKSIRCNHFYYCGICRK